MIPKNDNASGTNGGCGAGGAREAQTNGEEVKKSRVKKSSYHQPEIT